jgi:hypothetical protein
VIKPTALFCAEFVGGVQVDELGPVCEGEVYKGTSLAFSLHAFYVEETAGAHPLARVAL